MNYPVDLTSRSTRNRFASVRLDRCSELRDDPAWIERALAGERARFVPLWRSRNLLRDQGGRVVPVYLDQRPAAAATAQPTLLGDDGGHVYFAVPLDDDERDRLLAAHPGAEFRDLRRASPDLAPRDAGILAYARAMMYWQHRHRYCGFCGHPHQLLSAGHRVRCTNEDCGRDTFPRIDPAIIVLITHEDACLLGRNPKWPPRRFSTLAGFVEPGESLEDAVAREVWEEARVRLRDIRYQSSQPWPFPAAAMCGFYAEAERREARAGDELEEVRWFTAPELATAAASGEVILSPPVSIAFRLQADWFRAQGGGDLEAVTRGQAAFR